MNSKYRRHAIFLGVRISAVFLLTLCIIIFAAYYTLSGNFHRLLTEYSITLVQAMVDQGVQMVEAELEDGRWEALIVADAFAVPVSAEQTVEFPQIFDDDDIKRLVYVTATETQASDGRKRDIREREDIQTALAGNPAVYGPYYNEEQEYVVCYSAPVWRDGNIVGVLSIEKDGYRFCEVIKDIRFVNSGESYILNAEGTDIAVSDLSHIEWVTAEYNAQRLYAANNDPTTKAIMELEMKGLSGERGYGTYQWENSLCYVVYAPIASVDWVLLAGLREEEIAQMTQSALFASISKGSILEICFGLFLVLTLLIIFWIISSTKKNAEINEKLEIIANHDPLTGLLNRRYLETNLLVRWQYPIQVACQAAVYMMDIDDFKIYNDLNGHQQGDDCIRHLASTLEQTFGEYNGHVLRYGGEEFMAVVFAIDEAFALELGQSICRLIEQDAQSDGCGGVVTISIGIFHVETTEVASLYDCIKMADRALYQAKREGKNRAVLKRILADEP